MDKIKDIITNAYKLIVYIIAFLLFSAILYFNIVSNKTSGLGFTLLGVILLGIFIFLINKFVINKINKKMDNIITIALLIIFLILEILAVVYFRVEYNWDFKYIMETAKQLYETNTTENLYYYQLYPNNIIATAIAYIRYVNI